MVAPASSDPYALLQDEYWRLNNLYWILDKNGNRVLFRMLFDQEELYRKMTRLNIVLKARQLGFTTFIQLFLLDRCLFTPNTKAGVIAHTREDAEDFFNSKIKFAYDNLPEELRKAIPADAANVRELRFSNGSSIRVGTSHRGGTLQYLHISEYGKLCAQRPGQAAEVRTGALNTVAPGNFVFIESTAEGRTGDFFDKCMAALNREKEGIPATALDYTCLFFPWFNHSFYQMEEPVPISEEMEEYFKQVEDETGHTFTLQQKYWYVVKQREQGDEMHQEYPCTPEEAFEAQLKGAIFAAQIREARAGARIGDIPHVRGVPVNTFWDLGRNDFNAIWFHQVVGQYDHFIRYYENRLVDITHYIEVLSQYAQAHKYVWGEHYLPHDGARLTIDSIAGSARDILQSNGFRTRITKRPTIKSKAIEEARRKFGTCRFDRKLCDQGIKALEAYQWTWDEKGETFRKIPFHNWASNGADALQTWANGWKGTSGLFRPPDDDLLAKQGHHGYSRDTRGKKRSFAHVL